MSGTDRHQTPDQSLTRALPALAIIAILLLAVVALAGNNAPDFDAAPTAAETEADEVVETSPEPESSDSGSLFGFVAIGLALLFAVAALKILDLRQLLRLAAIAGAGAVALLSIVPLIRPEPMPLRQAPAQEEEVLGVDEAVQGREWIDPLWLAAPATAAVTVGLAVAYRRNRRYQPSENESPPTVDEALRATLIDIELIADAREAVISAYARLEQAMAEAGLARGRSETSREYVGRVLTEMGSDPAPVATLGRLYEHARFDASPIGESERLRAAEALRSIRDSTARSALK